MWALDAAGFSDELAGRFRPRILRLRCRAATESGRPGPPLPDDKLRPSSCEPPFVRLRRQTSHDLFARDGMLPNPHAAGVVNRIRDGTWDSADAGFAEALNTIEPARLQAVDVDLGCFGNV